ncbi:AzlC family ABC transporter permease [Halioxenophilus aromaticivorans]|uniref:AzlC family ABC transporter permease n=1 Tax=Halioxenophilus aromaticivorans TaxID=1306992 RepID=A0AAV3U7B0_9ALTE
MNTRSAVKQAAIDAIPLCLPAIPFAFVIGLAIHNANMNPALGWSSSWIIFGGAAQLTLITLLGAGSGVLAAISAALVVNARHLMYSAALAPHFQHQPRWMQWFGPYVLIDQSFALAMLRDKTPPEQFRAYYLTAGFTFWGMWQITTALGLILGPVVPASWELQFAVPILFLAMVVMGIDGLTKLVAALVGAGVTLLCIDLPNKMGLLVGALCGIIAGSVCERIKP